MNLIEQINSHEYLYLEEIGEPEVNVLRLVIAEVRGSNEVKDLTFGNSVITGVSPIVSDETCHTYEIIFGSYIAYSVLNESYVPGSGEEEIFTGRLFCVYSKSPFLNYIQAATFASEDYPGRFTHYGINCLDHVVEVVSIEEPQIMILREPW